MATAAYSPVHLSHRAPLAPLPITHFLPSSMAHPSLPSPVSLPLKRSAASQSSICIQDASRTPTSPSSKVRRLSYSDPDGGETVKRVRVRQITPKAREVLDRDELGIGKSPARRLFADANDETSPASPGFGTSGISGAVVTPTRESRPNRALAPSPPIAAPTPSVDSTLSSSTDSNVDVHDRGFEIFNDAEAPLIARPSTPDSTQQRSSAPSLAPVAGAHLPSSPADSPRSQSISDENQENIPPPAQSISSTPSKSSLSSAVSSPASRHSKLAEEEYSTPGSASRHRRTIERSKLVESVIFANEEDDEVPGEDLTPGRRIVHKAEIANGKARLTREVYRI